MAEEATVETLEDASENEESWKVIQPVVELSSLDAKIPRSNYAYGEADGGSLGKHEETLIPVWPGEDVTGKEVLIKHEGSSDVINGGTTPATAILWEDTLVGREELSDQRNFGSTVEVEEVRKMVRAFRRGTLTNEEFEEESRQLLAGEAEAVRLEELLKLGRAFRNKKLTAGEVDQSIAKLFTTARSRIGFEEMHLEHEEAE